MTRYDAYAEHDDQPVLLGDRGFVGVNMRLDPSQLPPGYVSEAVNCRFRRGIAEPRLGSIVPPWANKIVSGQVQPWGVVYGVGLFSDPFTFQDYLVIAADGGVYYTQPHNAPQAMTLPAGVTITSAVTFTQAFDVLVMHRGPTLDTLVLDRITNPWTLVSQSPSGDGIYPIPNATHSVFFQNRLFIPTANDEIAVSDIGDYTRYSPVEEQFRVNQGSSDKLVAIYKFSDSTLVAFKERSIYAINNVYGTLDALQQLELTSQFGCAARASIAQAGSDLWFLSELGVMSLRQTEENKLKSVLVPMSDPIQPLIDRINWRYASGAVAAYWDNKYYLAVPLDDAETLGPELLSGNYRALANTYEGAGLVVGATYRWTKGANEESFTDGTTTLTTSGDFTAAGSTFGITGTAEGVSVTASLKRLFRGANNAVLVFDFLNKEWAGYDTHDDLNARAFVQVPVLGRARLLSFQADGYVRLEEDDFEDQRSVPYTDVVVSGTVSDSMTVSVNGGATVTAFAADYNNDGGSNRWGINGTVQSPAENLLTSTPGGIETGGFAPYTISGAWSAPNAIAFKIASGVRFYGTNGVIPAVTTTGSWATVTETGTRPIATTLVTRGYVAEDLSLLDNQWLAIDLQTWAPQFSVDAVFDGVNEEVPLEVDKTRDRSHYYQPAEAEAFDLDNDAGDFLTPHREDYSVLFGPATSAATGACADFALHTTEGGVAIDLHQETRNTWRVNGSGRAARVRLTNTQGRCRLMAVAFQCDTDTLRAGTQS